MLMQELLRREEKWMKITKFTVSMVLAMCLLFAEPGSIYAEEKTIPENIVEEVVSEGTETAEEILPEDTETVEEAVQEDTLSQEQSAAAVSEGLKLSVTYPKDIKCGEPVTFRMTATGGTGDYKYRIHSLTDDTLTSIYDISYGSNGAYTENNEFKFTFYASGTYYIRFSVMDMSSSPYQTATTGMYEYPVVIRDERYPSVQQIVSDVAAQCEAECSTDFEKALWLHDYIIDNAEYDYSYSYCSAEGVLARGTGTCESYHRAYVMLLNKLGIETGRMEGNMHVWTAVKLDGEWYQVDSTWDDMGASNKDTYYEHMYFGLTDEIMHMVHSEHSAVPGYESRSLKNNYFIRTGEIKQWSDPYAALGSQNIKAGKKQFVLQVSDSMPDSYKNVIYNLVAYQLSTQNWGKQELKVSYADSQLTCTVKDKTNPGGGNGGETVLTGKARFIGLLYENALGRKAAQSEIDYWIKKLEEGKTGAEVAYGFLFSKEFEGKNYNNGDYVEHLYLSIMGRPSDPKGKADWVESLENGVSRKYVFKQFLNSNEFQKLCNTYGIKKGDVALEEARDQNYNVTCFVSRNYTEFLGRRYEVDGLNYWCNIINNHEQTMQQVAYGYVFSEECKDKNLSDREYIKMLYRGCFGREGEQAGIRFYMEKLQSGEMSREDVFYGFANSPEFAELVKSYGL